MALEGGACLANPLPSPRYRDRVVSLALLEIRRRCAGMEPLAAATGPVAGPSTGDPRLERVGYYSVGKTIGRGNFATVRLARHHIAKAKVALKVVDRKTIDAENLLKIDREIRILKTLEHPHIVKLYEVMRTERFLYIVTEYCNGGEMFEVLIDRGRIAEDEARKFFVQAASAVAYCHERGVVHRDLKAENILLDKNGDVKIIDFGFANFQTPNQLLHTWCGSPPYAAPELLLGKEYDGTRADVWSLGVFLYILVTGGYPFPADSIDKLKRAVLSGCVKIPYWVSVECSDILRKMLVLNPAKRYSIFSVLQHRWISMGPKPPSVVMNDTPNSNATVLLVSEKRIQKLNPTVLLFIQQHSQWTEEQILEEVTKQNVEGPIFPTYELLCDKVGRSTLEGEGGDHPRRGSRGSILSGRANEQSQPAPTIPAHHLAKLNLSTTPEYDSDDSSGASELCEDSPSTSSRRQDYQEPILPNSGPFNMTAMTNAVAGASGSTRISDQRRHTLCASDPLPALDAWLVSQLPADSPLAQAAAAHAAAAAALAAHNAAHPQFAAQAPPWAQIFPSGLTQNHGQNHSFYPLVDYTKMLPVPNNERRASAGEALFGIDGYERLLQLADGGAGLVLPSTSTALTVEEEGQRYLMRQGANKRNTVHGFGGGVGPAPTVPQAPYPNLGSPSQRHTRSPYQKQPNGERRSSWTSAIGISPQQQAQLDMLYKKTVAGGSDQLYAIKQLQQEFEQLKAQNSFSHISPSRTPPADQMSKCTPRISITDENNRCLQGGSSANFDPVSMFEQKANEVIYGQRPATVIGFAPSSGASSPDFPNGPNRWTSPLHCPKPSANTLDDIRSHFEERALVYNFWADPERDTVRVAVCPDEGSRLEVGVCGTGENECQVDFHSLPANSPACEELCRQILARLSLQI